MLKVKLLHPAARLPTRGTPTDAGLDLYSDVDGEIKPGQRVMFSTGISMSIPDGYVAYVRPRSGLAAKHGIDVLAGVIDSSYRGQVRVLLINHGGSTFEVYEGDRIAQLVIHKIELWKPELVEELDETERGANGFGSTGR